MHFGCFEMSAGGALEVREAAGPLAPPHLHFRSGGGNLPASCAKACAEAERTGGTGRGARAGGVTLLPGSREALQPRGEFLRGEGVSASPPPPGLPRRAVPWELADPGICAVGGGGHGSSSGAEEWVGRDPPPAARAAPARHLLIFAPHPPGAPHPQALALVGQGCS